jgi:hypothetical protein
MNSTEFEWKQEKERSEYCESNSKYFFNADSMSIHKKPPFPMDWYGQKREAYTTRLDRFDCNTKHISIESPNSFYGKTEISKEKYEDAIQKIKEFDRRQEEERVQILKKHWNELLAFRENIFKDLLK